MTRLITTTLLAFMLIGSAHPATAMGETSGAEIEQQQVADAASELRAAKAAGRVGERLDGLLGAVEASPDAATRALVSRVNAGRLEEYRRIAAENNLTLEAVQAHIGQRLVREAPSGTYVTTPEGRWMMK